MVPVAVDHRDEVLLHPFLEQFGIAVFFLGNGPGVGELVQHQEAHSVAQVQELRGRGIVRGADGVAAHFLKHFEAADPGVFVPDGAQGARVVMQAHALEEGLLAVQIETVGAPFGLADAERCFISIQYLVGRFHGGAGQVHHRIIGAPEGGVRQLKSLDDGFSVLDVFDAAGFGDHAVHNHVFSVPAVAVLADDLCPDHPDGLFAFMPEGDAEGESGICHHYFGLGCHFGDIPDVPEFRCDIRSPVGDGGLACLRDPDVAVQAAAGIPAGGFLRIVQADGDFIGACPECGGQVHGEGGIAVGPTAQIRVVHADGRVRHRPVDFQADFLGFKIFCGDIQLFPIDGLSPPGQFSGFAGIGLVEGAFHAPVVGQVDRSGHTSFLKGPPSIKLKISFFMRTFFICTRR